MEQLNSHVVECIAKLKSGKFVRLNYNRDLELWYYPSTDETPSAVKRDCSDIVSWVNCSEIDRLL